MALMTHAHIQTASLPIATDYTRLAPEQKAQFSDWLEAADRAGTGTDYHQAMTEAALTAEMAVPDSRDIALCDCLNDGCGCGAIFDSHTEGVHVVAGSDPGYSLSRLQCPDCSHDHPRDDT